MQAKRILVIDDDDAIREVAQVALELVGGMEVLLAASGEAGLEVAKRERPDAILLDVMMPGIDGPSTFRRLQADPTTADIPVVLLTAKVQAADSEAFKELGLAATLTKPFDPMTVASQVRHALRWGEPG